MAKKQMKLSGNKIFRKYFLFITSIILVSIILICSIYVVLATRFWSNQQLETLQVNTHIVATNSEDILKRFSKYNSYNKDEDDENDVDISPLMLICNTLSQLSSSTESDIFIVSKSGDVVVCKEMLDNMFDFHTKQICKIHKDYKISSEILEQATSKDYTSVSNVGELFTNNQLVSASPIKINNETAAFVFAIKPITANWYAYIKDVLQIFLMAIVFSMIISFIIVYRLSYQLTKPLKQMSIATKRYAQGDFSYQVQVKGNDEMAELAKAFNTMAHSLADLESSRRSFVANVSHELKTPMTSIGGFIDGMLDGTVPPEKYDYYLKIVSDEIKRLSRLVTGMLNMSKLEAGQMPINYREFDLSNDVFKTLLSFEKKIEEKSIEITGLDKMHSIIVEADEDMMQQVIYNLIDNAVKFTPPEGYIDINAYEDETKAYVCIKNSGAGIEKTELNKVFERFYKIDKSRSYDVKGAGLGLYLVKSIVELHSGEIKVESTLGEFTEFAFFIPKQQNKDTV